MIKNQIKNILIVQLYSNGDCLYATAIAKQIKYDFPNSYLIWAVSRPFKNVLYNNPFIDSILPVDGISKNDVNTIRKFREEVMLKKKEGVYDEVFFVHNADINNVYFNGNIRASILDAYPFPISVSIQPVMRNTENEIKRVLEFVNNYRLSDYEHVILFEFSPQSGQINISEDFAIKIAESIVVDNNVAVILSSAIKLNHTNSSIIDGSELSFRETAFLTHYCTLMIGCSSGITWLSTSDGAKLLPMIQLLNPKVRWFNPVSADFKRFSIKFDKIIDLVHYDHNLLLECVLMAIKDFYKAKRQFSQEYKLGFRTTRSIINNFLFLGEFRAVYKHIRLNIKFHGFNLDLIKQIAFAFLFFPHYYFKYKYLNSLK